MKKKKYIGVKMLSAMPMTRGEFADLRKQPCSEAPEEAGYLVQYTDDYQSWSPKAVFEAAYFPMADTEGTTILQDDVDLFVGNIQGDKLTATTTLVRAEDMATGFSEFHTSSCAYPSNYDHDIGVDEGRRVIEDRILKHLGFVLTWARNGLLQGLHESLTTLPGSGVALPEMDFGEALRALKRGCKVARKGWNGKNMFLFLREGRVITNVDPDSAMGGDFESLDHICMRTADGKCCVGWLASQTDMLSEDWQIVD